MGAMAQDTFPPSLPPHQVLAYDMGSPDLVPLYIDPQNGNDANDGSSPTRALQTLRQAWQQIPMGETLQKGYHIWLMAGVYPEGDVPHYWESRHGTPDAPIIVEAYNNDAVTITTNINIYDTHHFYWIGVNIITGTDAFHCEKCTHLLLRRVTLRGDDPETYNAQETLKVNQSQYIYVEDSTISGAWDNAVDYVAVQYGHFRRNVVSDSGDWCFYAKGGSAQLIVDGNEFFNCGTGGFTAGQGTGFQFMVSPWLQYEAYNLHFTNNIVHDTQGAAWGVQGGWKILIAHNTAWRVGSRSHLIEVVYGLRSCDGQEGDDGREACQTFLDEGGWGTTIVDDGTNQVRIPNRHVIIANNLIYNPAPYRSEYQHFEIFGAFQNPPESNIAVANGDEELLIVNNVIWNGGEGFALGVEDDDGCGNANPTCNALQLVRDNDINTLEPRLTERDGSEVILPNVAHRARQPLPAFAPESLALVPEWNMPNEVITAFGDAERTTSSIGAWNE